MIRNRLYRTGLWFIVACLLASCAGQPAPAPVVVPQTNDSLVMAPATPRDITVQTLYVAQDPASQSPGGVSAVAISVRPAKAAGDVQVEFHGDEASGIGSQWHSAAWMAIAVASLVLGLDPREYAFTFTTSGPMDGPDAGAALTAGVLAAVRGEAVASDIAVIGVVEPDGSVAPARRPAWQIQGAAGGPLKTVLIPAEQRTDVAVDQQQKVDLVELGHGLGLTVKEIATIDEAYEALTGKPLPHPSTSTSTPQIPSAAAERLKAKAQAWADRYSAAKKRYQKFAKRLQDLFAANVAEADQSAQKATNALQQGAPSAAYTQAWQAATEMQISLLTVTLVQQYLGEGFNAMTQGFKSKATAGMNFDPLLSQLKSKQPQTVAEQVMLADALANAALGQGLLARADTQVDQLQAQGVSTPEDQVVQGIATASADYILANSYLERAGDLLELAPGLGTAPAVSLERLQALAVVFNQATQANLAYLQGNLVDRYAGPWGLPHDQAEAALLGTDLDALLLDAASTGLKKLGDLPEVPAAELALGLSIGGTARTSNLLTKYESLGAQVAKDGSVTGLSRPEATGKLLDTAEMRAKDWLTRAGEEAPLSAILFYDNARQLRQGAWQDQLSALSNDASAVMLAGVAANLSGRTKGK